MMRSPLECAIVGIRTVSNRTTIGPLISTLWDQLNEYNAKCPPGCYAGCVAIAMAQIMKFHQWPARYNWANMPDNVATDATQTLISDVGIAAKMKYGVSGSSATINNAQDAFKQDFGYNAILKNHNSYDVGIELTTNRRPVFMRGFTSDGRGHAWVCAGYQLGYYDYEYFVEFQMPGGYMEVEGGFYNPRTSNGPSVLYFYMNWGWSKGKHNGWYLDDSVATPDGNFPYDRKNLYISVK